MLTTTAVADSTMYCPTGFSLAPHVSLSRSAFLSEENLYR